MLQERKLIDRMKDGDHDALRIIYVRHKDFLYTLAFSLLHDASLAEDVVHDVFVNFTRNICQFHLTGSLKSYLAACAVNQSRTLLRRKKVHAATVEFELEQTTVDPPCSLELQETKENIEQHLASLPYEQREVLVLRINAGLKFRQIAHLQQTKMSTVQARYRYGIEKLRSLLNGEVL